MKRFLSLIILSLMLMPSLYATGPSYIESEMRPITMNEQGDILCYTRFTKNDMGAGMIMPIIYGYCILTKDTIIHYTMKVLEWDENSNVTMDTYNAERNLWDNIYYKGRFREKYLISSVREQYNFTDDKIGNYKVDKTMSLLDFNKLKDIDIRKTRQKALYGVVSKNNYSKQGNRIHLLYDFGNIIILQNSIEESEKDCGSAFNYVNKDPHEGGVYSYSTVTGVLFIK